VTGQKKDCVEQFFWDATNQGETCTDDFQFCYKVVQGLQGDQFKKRNLRDFHMALSKKILHNE